MHPGTIVDANNAITPQWDGETSGDEGVPVAARLSAGIRLGIGERIVDAGRLLAKSVNDEMSLEYRIDFGA